MTVGNLAGVVLSGYWGVMVPVVSGFWEYFKRETGWHHGVYLQDFFSLQPCVCG